MAKPVGTKNRATLERELAELRARLESQGKPAETTEQRLERELAELRAQLAGNKPVGPSIVAPLGFGIAVVSGGKIMDSISFRFTKINPDNADNARYVGDDEHGLGRFSYLKLPGWSVSIPRSTSAWKQKD